MQDESDILNPTVYIGHFEFREPVTTLTDFSVAIVAAIGIWYLTKNRHRGTKQFNYYRYYFIFFAVGMTSAAWLGHGLQAYVSADWKMIGWFCSLSAQLSLAWASFGQVRRFIHPAGAKIIRLFPVIVYLIFLALIINPSTRNFKIPQFGNALLLAGFTFPLQLFYFMRVKNTGFWYLLAAIVLGALTGMLYNNQVSISRWFNYHDISHCLVCITMAIMIFAAGKLALVDDSRQKIEFT
jgi:hypothetical protein